jgi:2-polyprenyl-3-methyl-5-hydroxy-6-metoxy-1,4-benzoquinol methylase
MTAFGINCNLCGHNDFRVIDKEESPFLVLRCNHCDLVFVDPQPDSGALKDHYCENYYSEWMNKQKNKRFQMWQNRLNKIQRLRSNGKLLDVGCGEGFFLSLAQANGWHITGTELSSFASKLAANTLKTDIYCGELDEAKFAKNSFDVVTMWHVLEHVKSPKNYLKEIHRILKPEGLLVLAVPNVNDLLMKFAYRIFKGRSLKLFSINGKEVHLYHFSPETLCLYFDKTGFDCLQLSPDYGIVQFPKKIVNWISVIPYYIADFKFFNAIETFAMPRK